MDAITLLNAVNNMSANASGNDDAEQQQQYQLDLMREQDKYNRAAMNQQKANQKEMYEYTGYESKVRQLKAAGLNPALVYGMGGTGGGTTGGGAALGVGLGSAPNVNMQTSNKIASQGMMLQLQKLTSEIELNKSIANRIVFIPYNCINLS